MSPRASPILLSSGPVVPPPTQTPLSLQTRPACPALVPGHQRTLRPILNLKQSRLNWKHGPSGCVTQGDACWNTNYMIKVHKFDVTPSHHFRHRGRNQRRPHRTDWSGCTHQRLLLLWSMYHQPLDWLSLCQRIGPKILRMEYQCIGHQVIIRQTSVNIHLGPEDWLVLPRPRSIRPKYRSRRY